MKGVYVKKATEVSNDSRRIITEIMNGEVGIRNLKVLEVKKGEGHQLLGNHWHPYAEVMYVIKGMSFYRMKNIDTGEIEDFYLVAGDVVYRSSRIVHAGWFDEGSMIIDAAEDAYVSADYNDIVEVILE